ncbi:MAG: hypothetical protein AB7I48_14460 [Planctomycetaceae bacterium]
MPRPVRSMRLLLLLCCCNSSVFADDAHPLSSPAEPAEFPQLPAADVLAEPDELSDPPDDQPAGVANVFLSETDDDAPHPAIPYVPVMPVVPDIVDASVQGWVNPLHDDNTLMFRETRDDTSFISHRGGFGMTTLGFAAGVQMGSSGVFSVQPKFGWHFLHGPLQPDLPPQLYDLSLEANFAKQIDDVWSLHLQVAPTLAADFDNKNSDAFRLIAGGLVGMQLSPAARLVGGLTYLDRPDLPVVPVAGLRLAMNDFAVDLLIPQPRVAYRYHVNDEHTESWVYVGGALGGGSWAYERENTGLHDVVGYRDYRLLIGHETKSREGIRNVIEAGYVFERHLEFDRGPGDFSPGDSWVIRIGLLY